MPTQSEKIRLGSLWEKDPVDLLAALV